MAGDSKNLTRITLNGTFASLEAELFEAVRAARTRLVDASDDEKPQATKNFKKALDAFRWFIVDDTLPQAYIKNSAPERCSIPCGGSESGLCLTITYPTGAVREGVMLTDDDNLVRVCLPSGEVRKFTRVQGVWLSDACEPVILMFQMVGI